MIRKILVAVEDSPDSLAAARLAIELAGALGATLLVVHATGNHTVDAAVAAATGAPEVTVRRSRSQAAFVDRVAVLARQAHVEVSTRLVAGHVGEQVLGVAEDWGADLVVVGRSARGPGHQAYVGPHARHVLEFADQAVLVVPGHRPPAGAVRPGR